MNPRLIGIIMICCALIAACSQPSAPAGPKFTGRLLLLSGDKTSGADLLEMTAAPDGSTYNYSPVTKGVFEAAPSPDRTRLLYTTKDGILLRDLHTGEVKTLIKGDGYCLAWAPDGNRFSYKQKSTLYISDLQGKSKLVWEDPPGPSAAAEKADGSLGCAHWIAPDRLLFDRFVGAAIKQKGGELKPNTTTLAILGDSVKLSDNERKWSIESVCQAGSGALVRPHDQAQPILVARNLDNLKTLNPAPISCSGCRFIGFAAQSCVPYFIEDSTSTSSDLFTLNPNGWQRLRGGHVEHVFSLTARGLINSAGRLMVLGDVPASLLLIDTDTGATTSLVVKTGSPGSGGGLAAPTPVVWIEN
jgi:hypothetical protein